ncbi:MAG TPA: EAL domain-containing protein [Rhodanobacteraceae bacterium]|nr:EAL domain-containing protein [Rhodanobacteraceae bacterium]
MAGDVHHLAVPASHVPAAAASLRATGELWAAGDIDGIVGAARHLLETLVPGAGLQRSGRKETVDVAEAADYRRWIQLTEREVLVITASPDRREEQSLLDSATALIDARIQALNKQSALTDSVEQLGRAERLQRALYAIADQASDTGGSLTEMFKALHAIVGTLTYAENFFIALYDTKQDTVRFPYFADNADHVPTFASSIEGETQAGAEQTWRMDDIAYGPTWYVIHDGKPLMGSLAAMGEQVAGPFHVSGSACEDWLGVPLLHGGKPAGCVVVQSYDAAHHYNEQDRTLLIYVAQHIQTALERRLAHAELEHRVEERTEALREANRVLQQQVLERQRGERLQAALFRIAELASTTDRLDNFYTAIHRVVGGLLYARNFYIALLSEDGTQLTFPYSVDERDVDRPPRTLTNGLTEYVLRNGTALLANAPEIARLRATGDVAQQGQDSVCWLGVPLVCADHTAGALAVQSYSPEHRYTLRDQELLTFVSYHIANALERVRAAESLRRAYSHLEHRVGERTRALALANRDLRAQIAERERIEARLKYETLHDSLTGLPNRTLLLQRLERALERYRTDPANGFAVLFMDLDRFKVINDSVGHLVGDDLLFQAGNRIRACLKSEDMVARLGGDEFGVLLEGVRDTSRACRIAERIINDLNAPFRLASKELFTSTSVGITLAAPHYKHPDELLRDADSAMYRAKSEGRHRYALFDEGLRRDAVSLLEVENDLRRGLTRDEFVPYYQPVVDIETGKVIGYEALMRWRHPQRGVLLPGEFLSVAEDTGTSETIDWQIFTQVCRDANALAGSNDAFVAINLSARHFSNPELDQRLLGLLAEYAVSASRFRVEVTERALLENTPAVKRTLGIFRRAGISISLDDFGTGYSSLSYLHQYPLQTLKVDQSFVASLGEHDEGNSSAVVRAILAMATTLSMQAIAEGVETVAQRDLLRTMGCRYVQGFLYSKAQPVDAWIGSTAPSFPV